MLYIIGGNRREHASALRPGCQAPFKARMRAAHSFGVPARIPYCSPTASHSIAARSRASLTNSTISGIAIVSPPVVCLNPCLNAISSASDIPCSSNATTLHPRSPDCKKIIVAVWKSLCYGGIMKNKWRKPIQLTLRGASGEAWAYVSKSGKTVDVYFRALSSPAYGSSVCTRISISRIRRWVGK